jgi:hydrogenase maturation protease
VSKRVLIIGYGNSLRGEDAFGVDVVDRLESINNKSFQTLKLLQLTPEISLKLLEFDKVIFVDAVYSESNRYKFGCSLIKQENLTYTHHITPQMLIEFTKTLYNHSIDYSIYSIFTSNFDYIEDRIIYTQKVEELTKYLITLY